MQVASGAGGRPQSGHWGVREAGEGGHWGAREAGEGGPMGCSLLEGLSQSPGEPRVGCRDAGF